MGGTTLLALSVYLGLRAYVCQHFAAAADRLERYEVEAGGAGLPLTKDELYKGREFPAEQNACPDYKKAIADLKTINKSSNSDYQLWPSRYFFGNTETKEEILREAKRRSSVINALISATRKPGFSARNVWEEYRQLKAGIDLLSRDAWLQAHLGNHDQAIKEIAASYRITNDIGKEPEIHAFITQIRAHEDVSWIVERMLPDLHKNAKLLLTLRNIVASSPPLDLKQAWQSHCIGGLADIEDMAKSPRDWNSFLDDVRSVDPIRFGSKRISPIVPHDLVTKSLRARFLECMAYGQAEYLRTDDFYSATAAFRKRLDDGLAENDPSYLLVTLFDTTGDQFDNLVRTYDLRKGLLIATIDLLLYKLKSGEFPANLQEAGIQLKDPFGTGPVLYKLTKQGFTLYSVGPDAVDGGGSIEAKADIGYAFPSKPRRLKP